PASLASVFGGALRRKSAYRAIYLTGSGRASRSRVRSPRGSAPAVDRVAVGGDEQGHMVVARTLADREAHRDLIEERRIRGRRADRAEVRADVEDELVAPRLHLGWTEERRVAAAVGVGRRALDEARPSVRFHAREIGPE